jgi:hypothetical protein
LVSEDVEADGFKPSKRRMSRLDNIQKTRAKEKASRIEDRHECILSWKSDIELRVVVARMRKATPDAVQ